MTKNRLEAFSDGVIAIIITIMVLEMKTPHGSGWEHILPLWPVFLSYVLSFIYVGIYWNNHHHLLHAAHKIDGPTMWANLLLLFWLSLIPFVTGWMGENEFAALPVAAYGVVLLCCAVAYAILTHILVRHHGADSLLARSIGRDFKAKASLAFYLVAVLVAFAAPFLSCMIYAAVAAMWFVPDRRIEKTIDTH